MVQLDFAAVLVDWPLLLRGASFTLVLTEVATVLGLTLGIACARARSHGGVALRLIAGVYVEWIRNTPFIIQLFFIFFGLPSMGLRLSADARRAGIALLTEDRKRDGLLFNLGAGANITIGNLGPLSRNGIVSGDKERNAVLLSVNGEAPPGVTVSLSSTGVATLVFSGVVDASLTAVTLLVTVTVTVAVAQTGIGVDVSHTW